MAKKEQSPEKSKEESVNLNDPSEGNSITDLMPLFKELLDSGVLKESVNKYFENEKHKTDVNKTIQDSNIESNKFIQDNNIRFWKMKYSKEAFIIFLVLVAVSSLALTDHIDKCTLGTLLGSIIGYTIGNFNSNKTSND